MKCEVLKDAVLVVKEGSIVIIDEKQYESAKHLLRPVEQVEKAVATPKKERTVKKK